MALPSTSYTDESLGSSSWTDESLVADVAANDRISATGDNRISASGDQRVASQLTSGSGWTDESLPTSSWTDE